MRPLDEKQNILDNEGYIYNFKRMIFFNRDAKKVFSLEHIEDVPVRKLEQEVREKNNNQEWQFYFNSDPSDAVRHELVKILSNG